MKFLNQALLLSFVMMASNIVYAASEAELLPDALDTPFNSAPGLAIGFGIYSDAKQNRPHFYRAQFTVNQCVTGDIKDEVINVKSVPYTNPIIVITDEGVKVIFTAQASNRRVISFGAKTKLTDLPKLRFKDLCGEQYISEAHIGQRIAIIRTFRVATEDQERLVSTLKSRLPDLRALLKLDLSKDNFKFSGAGIGLSGGSTELSQKMNTCFWQGKDCNNFIAKAYSDAAELDKNYPAGRVANLVVWGPTDKPFDSGSFLLYKMTPYKK